MRLEVTTEDVFEMTGISREIRKFYGMDGEVSISCKLTSATPYLWFAKVEKPCGCNVTVNRDQPVDALEELLNVVRPEQTEDDEENEARLLARRNGRCWGHS